MKILVVLDSKDDYSTGQNLLAEDYPEAERAVVADLESLVQALQEESHDLVLASYHLSWIARPDLTRIVQQHQLGLPIVLVNESSRSDPSDIQEALGQSRQVFETLLNSPAGFIILFDMQRKVLLANQTFLQRIKKRREEILGRTLIDILPQPLAEKRDAMLRQVLETGETIRFVDQGVDGWLDSTIFPIINQRGQITHAMVYAHDITDRKNMENDLRESMEEALRRDQKIMLAMANAPKNIFLVLDRHGTILMTNEVMARSFDCEADNLIGLCFWDILPKPVAEFRRSVFNKVLQTGVAERVDDQGRFGVYDSWVIPISDDQGEIIQVVIIARDISDRKQMEVALQESEQRYRTLIETSPDGIIYFDLGENFKSRPLIINQRFASLFGYENAEEIIQLGLAESDLVAEQDHPRLSEILQAGLQQGYIKDVILTARRKNGSEFQLEANGSMVFDKNGKPQGFLGICRDVTERILIQQELVRARENLEQRVLERTAELQALNRQLQKEVFLRKEAENKWKRHALHSEALARVASRANTHLDIITVLKTICDEVIRAIPFSICSISLYREEDDSLNIAGYASKVTINHFDIPPTPRPQFEEFVQQFGSIITIPDVAILPLSAHLATTTTPNIRTLVIMPFYRMGEMIGSLNLASVGEIRLPTDEELDLLRAISDQAALSITNARLFEHVSDSQARLKILTERLVDVQEEEKRRLARELHDEIGQMLTSLSLNLEIVSRSVQAGEEKGGIQFELEVTRQQVKQLLEEVRDLSLNLLPAMLDDLGLLPTLLDYCQRYTSQTGILVNLSHRGLDERVPPQVEIAAYRIVQEALTNVARHAAVDQVDVRLWATSKRLGVQIEDQGVGFVLQEIESAYNSHGIAGMRERAVNCSGSLEIETSPGMGVCLTAEFPLTRPDQNPESR